MDYAGPNIMQSIAQGQAVGETYRQKKRDDQ